MHILAQCKVSEKQCHSTLYHHSPVHLNETSLSSSAWNYFMEAPAFRVSLLELMDHLEVKAINTGASMGEWVLSTGVVYTRFLTLLPKTTNVVTAKSAMAGDQVVAKYGGNYTPVARLNYEDDWTKHIPDLSQVDDVIPLVQEYTMDPRIRRTRTGDCDRYGVKGVSYKKLRCFFNILRRCKIGEALCELNLRYHAGGRTPGTIGNVILTYLLKSVRSRPTYIEFITELAAKTFKGEPKDDDVFFAFSLMYAMVSSDSNGRHAIGKLHLALRRVSRIKEAEFLRLYDVVLSSTAENLKTAREKSGLTDITFRSVTRVQKRAQVPILADDMYTLCNLGLRKDILAGCLAGIAGYCQDRSSAGLDLCHKYYETTFAKSMYAKLIDCANWKKGPDTPECSAAVKSICGNDKVGSSGECWFATFTQTQVFTSQRLAPW